MGKSLATVKGGFFAQYAPTLGGIDRYNLAKDHRNTAQTLAHKGDFEIRELTDAIIRGGVGTVANASYAEIEANVEMGGRRNIVNTSLINRATTANDVADIREVITSLSSDTTMPNPVYNGDRNPLGTR